MNTIAIISLIFVSFILGMLLGLMCFYDSSFQYKTSTIMTCEYANKLTNITNQCSATLKLYTGTDYQILNNLDCDLITKR